jgi:hypothetical protein
MISRLTYLFATLLVLLFLFVKPHTATASHVMGADISWECIGPNQYRISLTLYRDCNGISLGSTASLSINRCGTNQTLSLTRVAGYPQDITPVCAGEPTRCNGGGGTYGFEAHLYQAVITFPAGCNNIVFTYDLCCRNNAITTLTNPGGQNLTISATLNNTLSPCDNSPRFLNIPTSILCRNQQTFYNHGGFDPDGDSLRYSLVPCRNGTASNVTYAGGFSATSPLTTASGVTINAQTGALSFTPTALQVGVLCVRVDEFRNGVQIGSTIRDLQFTVINCTNILPTAVGVDSTGTQIVNSTVSACFGQQFCFNINGIDQNTANTINMTWNGAIPGASFTTVRNAPNSVTGTFCWTPTFADIGQNTFTVTVRDNACPINGQNTFTFIVNVIPNINPPVVISRDTSICAGQSVNLVAISPPPTPPNTVRSVVWTPATGLNTNTGTSVIATPTTSTIYQVAVTYSDGCVSRDFAVVNVRNAPTVGIIPNGINVCPGGVVTLTGTTDANGLNYQWFDPDSLPLGSGNVSGAQSNINVNIPNVLDTTYCYNLLVTNPTSGCSSTEEACLNIGPPQGPIECINIYATPTGNPNGSGTQADPTTLNSALRRAGCNNTVIKLAIGTYNIDTTIELSSFLTIEGGFNPALGWAKTSQQGATTILRTTANPIGIPGAYQLVAVNASNLQGFRLQDLTIRTANATLPGTSTYGLRLASCSDYNIVRCQISSGNASNGAAGTVGLAGLAGENGSNGVGGAVGTNVIAGGGIGGDGGGFSGFGFGGPGGNGGTNPPSTPSVGQGGDSATVASSAGGGGGGGGSGNVHLNTVLAARAGGGAGSGGVPPGIGGVPAGSVNTSPCGGGDGGGGAAGAAGNTNGVNGTNGITGANGANAPIGSAGSACSYYSPGLQALQGQSGAGGTGGCGGGGARANAPNNGGGGGAGGGGGSGGDGGTGGTGGGGSFGVYIYNNGANGNLTDCNVSAGTAGSGGVGGNGGTGGAGGTGGTGAASGGNVSTGGNGGNGGIGGTGGRGGNGAAGISQAVISATCLPGLPLATSNISFNLATQPVINVENSNCSFSPVSFTANTLPINPGVANWDFDLFTNFANPPVSVNNPGITQYDSIRRYSISQGVNTYTGFHHIQFSASIKPNITSTANVIGQDTFQLCVGEFSNFCSDIFGDTVIWNFAGSIPNPGSIQCTGSTQFNTPGCYLITLSIITDCCGFSPIDSAWLFVDPRPAVTASNSSVDICQRSSVTLTLNGVAPGDSVVWTPTTNLSVLSSSSVLVSPTDTTTYIATIYSGSNCGSSLRLACPVSVSFQVNVYPDLLPNASATPVICLNDGTATASPSGGSGNYTFIWNNGITATGISHTISGLASGNYCVTIVDNVRGCDTTACVFVNPAVALVVVSVDSSRNITCFGNNDGFIRVSSTNGVGPYNYVWSDGQTGDTRNNLAPGNYCVTATDQNGCVANVCTDITEPAVLTILSINVDSASCEYSTNGLIEIEGIGGTGFISYQWDNAASSQTTSLVTGLPGGFVYSVTATDANGCTANSSYNVPILYPVTPFANQIANVLCSGGNTASISAGASNGIGAYTVSITGPISATLTQSAGLGAPPVVFTNLPSGLYQVSVTDVNASCVDTTSIFITQPTQLQATGIVNNQVSCNGGSNASATVTASGATPGYTYLWSNGETNATAISLSAGVRCVTVTDLNSCQTVTCVTITEPTVLSVTSSVTSNYNGAQISCFGASNGSITAVAAGGTSSYSYLWSTGNTTQSVSGLPTGSYSVTTTDALGCTSTSTISISQPSAVTASIPTQTDVLCFGRNTGSATANGTGGTGTYFYNWNTIPGQFSITANGLSAGVYCVTVTDVNSCPSTACVTISQPALPVVVTASITSNYNGSQISCFGLSDGTASSTPSGGVGPYTYIWSNGQLTQNSTGWPAGTHRVTVTDFNGCTATNSFTIIQPTAVIATIPSQNNVLCFGQATGTATAAGSGGTGSYAYTWNTIPAQSTITSTGLSVGQICVTVSDANTCIASTCTTITQPSTPVSITAAVTSNYNGAQVSCFGASDATLSSTPSGGVAPYSYLWSTGANTQNINGVGVGVYSVIVTDFNGCTSTRSVTVTQPSAVTATLSQTNVLCFGRATGTATSVGSGGTGIYSYIWNTSPIRTTPSVSGLVAGVYCVTVSDINNCRSSNCVTITQPLSAVSVTANVISNYNGSQISCFGLSDGVLNATPAGGTSAYTFVWSTGLSNQILSGVSTGNYFVTVTDANGCTSSSSVSISQPSAVTTTVPVQTNVLCFGQATGSATAISVGGSGAPYSFSWGTLPVQNTATSTGLAAGSYCVTGTDINNCPAVACVTIIQPILPVTTNFNIISNVSCTGGNNGSAQAIGAGGTGSLTYLWDNGLTSSTRTGLSAGVYCVTVTDANGCTSNSCVTITEPSLLILNITNQQNVLCFGGNSGELSVGGSGGTSPYTYLWQGGQTLSTIAGLTIGVYCATVTDANGCTSSLCATITEPSLPLSSNVTILSNYNGFSISCFGSSDGIASANVLGGTLPYSYQWDLISQTTQTATGLGVGTYCVYVEDANGCRDTSCVTVTGPTPVVATITGQVNVLCYGFTTGSSTVNGSGGARGYTYLWSNGQTGPTATNLGAGIYGVTATDVNGCAGGTSVVISEPLSPVSGVVVVNSNVSCTNGNNGSATVTGSGGVGPYSYLWPGTALGQTSTTATGLTAGVYCVTITDANGCIAVSCATVTEPALLVAGISGVGNVNCFGGNTGSATAVATGGTGGYSYLWETGSTTTSITGLIAGSYNVSVTDANGCLSIAVATITEPSGALSLTTQVLSNYNGEQISCFGRGDGIAGGTASGGTAPYVYSWSNGRTTSTVTGLTAGTYTVTATDAGGCTTTSTVVLTQPTVLSAVSSFNNNVSCFGGNDGGASVVANGGTGGYSYVWTGGQTTSSPTTLSAGTQCVSVSDANGCQVVSCVTISQPATAPIVSVLTQTPVSCNGLGDGTATASTVNGTGPYTYQWDAAANGQQTALATGLTAGGYGVTATDANGCTTSATVVITEPSALSLTVVSLTNIICFGDLGSATLNASGGNTGGYTYNWSSGQSTSIVTGLTAGNYTVTASDVNGCSVSRSLSITGPSFPLSLSLTGTPVSCGSGNDGTLTATVGGGTTPYTYQWNLTGRTTGTLTGLTAGIYCLTLTDANGCSLSSCSTLTSPSLLTAVISNQTPAGCRGAATGTATVSGSGGTLPYSYLWSNGQTSQTATGLSASGSPVGVTITDASACRAVTAVIIIEPSSGVLATVTVTNNVSCFGGNNGSATVTGSGGTVPYTYLWGTALNETTQSVSGLTAGNYNVTVTDANGCNSVATATVTEPAVLSLNTAIVNVSCNGGSNGIATVTASGGTAPYSYSWSNGQTSFQAIGLVAGTYTVTVTDLRGCTITDNAVISQPLGVLTANINITSNYNGQAISCFGAADATAIANVTGGTTPYSYQWNSGSLIQTAVNVPAGTLSVTVTDANNCRSIVSTTVNQPLRLTASITSTAVSCLGGSNGTATAAGLGGTGTYSYQWGTVLAQTSQTITGLTAGAYCVTLTDINGCQASSCGIVTQPATAPLVSTAVTSNYNGSQVSCNGSIDGSIRATVVGGTLPYSYSWSVPGAISSTVSGLGAGVYNVTVTDAGGCTTTSTVTITNPAQLTASIAASSDATCAGGNDGTATAAGAGGTGGYSYNWNSSPVQTTQTATGLPAGNYIVIITDANGCQSFANVTIGQPLNAVVALTNVTSNYLGQQVSCAGGCDGTAQAFGAGGTGPYTYAWSNGQTGPTATGLCSNTNYTVTVADAVNCFSVATLTLSEPSAISLSTTQTAVSCNGGSDGTATVTATGGTLSTGYSYLWSNGQTTSTATGFAAGPHSVTVTDNNGCTAQTTVTITEPPTFLAVNIVNDTLYNGQQISCNGVCDAEFTVFASGGTGGFSYLWSNGSTATSQTGICPGVYTVTVSDSGGCGQVSSITITSPSAVSATISSQTNVGCAGTATGSFTIAATGGTPGYTYNIGTGPLSSSLFNNLGAGTYTVTVSDLNFCETQVNVTITQPSTGISATTSVTTAVSCNNFCDGAATVTATGGTAPYTYSWSNGQTSQTATGLCGGTNYTVEATDANGCEFITTLSMPNPALLTATLQSTTDELCSGAGTGAATIAAGGGTLPYSFNIGAGPQATGNFTGLTTGSYLVTVTDANGCSTTVPFIISGPPALVINSLSVTSNYNGSQVSCAGACDGAATVVGAGGTGTYTFLWSNGQTTFTATGLCNAGAPYGVTVTDQNGCSVSGVVTTFTEPSAITLTATNQINIGCAGATTGSFEIVATGGTPNYSYNIGTGNQPTGLYSNLSAGIYCVTVTDANNCQDVICVTVSQTSQMVLTMTPITGNLSCANSANGSAQVQPSGGTAPYTYLWANGQTTSIATGLSGGSQCVTVTDANLCTATACVTITGPTAVDITVVSTTNASCFGVADGRITVQATGGTAPYIYSINGGTIFTNQVTFNNLTGTVSGFTYTIIVRDANGCQDTTTATMFSPSQVQVLLVNEEDVTLLWG